MGAVLMRQSPAGPAPAPVPGLETAILRVVQESFLELPKGVAQLKVGRVPGHADWPNPYFELTPGNPNAATFRGTVVESDLNLTVGQRATREFVGFARGGTILRGRSPEEEFRSIWDAVIAGGFTEELRYWRQRILASRAKIRLSDIELEFGYAEWAVLHFLLKCEKRAILYEPY